MFSPEIATILSKLKGFFLARSVPAFLVGGFVRDSMRGIPTRDVDISAVVDSPSLGKELAQSLGGAFVPLGPAGQVARIVVPSPDQETWVVDVSSIEGSIYDDLLRRDFTVDAMALALEDWGASDWQERVIDPIGGKSDLSQNLIRSVSPSAFRDDPVRLLKAVRLSATLGFRVERGTANLIKENAPLISSAASERVRDEFLTILSMDGAKNHLVALDDLGLLCCIIPELGITKGVEQPREHHWDVYDHSINSVEAVERVTAECKGDPISEMVPWSMEISEGFAQEVSDGHTRRTLLKLGALLHDIAKPQTKTVDADGRTRFLGHHTLGAAMSGAILQRLRLSNRGVGMVTGVVEYHLRPTQMSQGGDLPTPRAVYRYFRDVGDVATDTLYLSLADHLAARGPDLDMGGWRKHVEIITHISEVGTQEQAPDKMPRLVTGHHLIQELGLAPGPLVGLLLESVNDAQAAGEVSSREEALAWARRRLEGLGPQAEHRERGLEGSDPRESGG